MTYSKFYAIIFLSLIVVFSTTAISFAHPHLGQVLINDHLHNSETEYTPINGIMGLEKTTLLFHAPEDNSLPWGFVEGKIGNFVPGYPVIIQIYKNDEAVHFAQTDVKDDGSYTYKFRVLNVENNQKTKIFDGDYFVTIFKVVYLNQNNLI